MGVRQWRYNKCNKTVHRAHLALRKRTELSFKVDSASLTKISGNKDVLIEKISVLTYILSTILIFRLFKHQEQL